MRRSEHESIKIKPQGYELLIVAVQRTKYPANFMGQKGFALAGRRKIEKAEPKSVKQSVKLNLQIQEEQQQFKNDSRILIIKRNGYQYILQKAGAYRMSVSSIAAPKAFGYFGYYLKSVRKIEKYKELKNTG